jgi:hypothetical protein
VKVATTAPATDPRITPTNITMNKIFLGIVFSCATRAQNRRINVSEILLQYSTLLPPLSSLFIFSLSKTFLEHS